MDDLKYMLNNGCYWKKKAPDMDYDGLVDLDYLYDKHDEDQEDFLDFDMEDDKQ